MNIYQKMDLNKTAIDEMRPFHGKLLNEIKNYYRIGLTWSSNAIEGNTLTESETLLLEDRLTIGGKPLREHLRCLVMPRLMILCLHCLTAVSLQKMIH